jgi:chromatin-remodeling ATPase INO80
MYVTLPGFAQLRVEITDKNSFVMQVQDIVVGSKQFSEGAKTSDIASLLLNDDELAMVNSSRNPGVSTPTNGDEQGQANSTIRNMWHKEGDDFFGHETSMEAALDAEVNDEIPPTVPMPTTAIALKRKGKGRAHKRKPGPATGEDISLKLPTHTGFVLTDLVAQR